MILKDAFRYQNYLTTMINNVDTLLTNKNFVMEIKQDHLRKAINPDAENESIIAKKPNEFDNKKITVNTVVSFLMDLYEQKSSITNAISAAKSNAKIDIDSSVAMNKVRKQIAEIYLCMARLKSYETEKTGYGKMLNGEKNPVNYTYDIKEVGTIDYDRNVVKSLAKKLKDEADKVSADIDMANITIEVNYTPKYDFDDSLEDCLEKFVGVVS